MDGVELTAQLCAFIFIAGRTAADLGDRIGDLAINALPFPLAVNDRVAVRSAMSGVHALAIIGLCILIAVTLGTTCDGACLYVEVGALVLAMAHDARNAGLFVCFCIRRVKFRCGMASDARVFDRLIQRVTSRT